MIYMYNCTCLTNSDFKKAEKEYNVRHLDGRKRLNVDATVNSVHYRFSCMSIRKIAMLCLSNIVCAVLTNGMYQKIQCFVDFFVQDT